MRYPKHCSCMETESTYTVMVWDNGRWITKATKISYINADGLARCYRLMGYAAKAIPEK